MKYILDFDRTVFDMEQLYNRLEVRGVRDMAGTVESLNEVGDISDLLFADALTFFKKHTKEDVIIVSSCHGKTGDWELTYQQEKLERSGVGQYVGDVVVVEGDKAVAIAQLVAGSDGRAVFVDDMEKHLKNIELAQIAGLQLVRIDRENSSQDTDFPTISSLDELDDIIKTL